MMRHKLLSFGKLAIVFCTLTFGLSHGDAQARNMNVRKVPAMSLSAHKAIQKIQIALDKKDFETTHSLLDIFLERQDLNDYERAVAWQLAAMTAFKENDNASVLAAYGTILALSDSIPEKLEISVLQGIAVLHHQQNNFDEALAYARQWEERVNQSAITTKDKFFLATLLMHRGELAEAEQQLKIALEKSDNGDKSFDREQLHKTQILIHWKKGEQDDAFATIKEALQAEPSSYLCRLLAGMYVEAGTQYTLALERSGDDAPSCLENSSILTPRDELKPPKPTPVRHRVNKAKPDANGNRDLMVANVPRLSFPKKATKKKVSGEVVLKFTVNPNGKIDKKSIELVSENPERYGFEKAAKKAISQLVYLPKLIGGVAQRVPNVTYRFSWDLDG